MGLHESTVARSSPGRGPSPLAAAIQARAGGPGVHATEHPGLHLLRADRPGRVQPVLVEPCVCVVAQGAKRALHDADVLRYDALHYLVLTVPLSLSCNVVEASPERPYLALRLDLDPERLAALLADCEGLDLGPAAGPAGAPERGARVSPTGPALVGALLRLLAALDDPAERAVLAPMAEREVLFQVLRGEQGSLLVAAAQRDASTHRVAAVIRHMKTHLADEHDVASLARRAAMSPSTFHAHFRAVTADSPLRYLKKMRLHSARGLMLFGGLGAAEAAAQVGYRSPSQFSREFRRQFGAPPVEETLRARAETS